jgi:hypothetical protein
MNQDLPTRSRYIRERRELSRVIADVLVLLVLAALGRHRLGELRARLDRWRDNPPVKSWLSHPFYRVVILTLVLLGVGWGATLSQMGWKTMTVVLSGEALPPSEDECQRCYQYQQNFFRRSDHFGNCPYEGELKVDEQGFLSCSRHGRPSDAVPLPP